MPDLEIIFKTRAELQGAKAALDQVERQIGQAKVLGQEYAKLEQQAAKMRSALANASHSEGGGFLSTIKEHLKEVIPGFESLSGVITKLASGPLVMLAAGFSAVASAFEVGKEALSEFAHAEKEVNKLDAALAQNALLTDKYREHLQELSEQMQDATGVANEQWLSALTRLTQFGAKPEKIDSYAKAVENLAGLMEGDVIGAAHAFSRALQGSFEVFARYGIVVDDAGTKTERLEKLMTMLASRGAGQLAASNEGVSGGFKKLGNAASDVMKEFGRMIASTGIVQNTLGFFEEALSSTAKAISGVIPKAQGLHNAIESSASDFEAAERAAKAFAVSQKSVADETERAAAAIQRQIEVMRAKQRMEDETADASLALTLAKIDRQEKEHKVTPEQAVRLRSGARTASAAAKDIRATAADQAEIAAKQGQASGIKQSVDDAGYEISDQEDLVKKIQDFTNRRMAFGKSVADRRKFLDAAEKAHFDSPGRYDVTVDGQKLKPWTNYAEFAAQQQLFRDKKAENDKREQEGTAAFEQEGRTTFRPGTGSLALESAKLKKMQEAFNGDMPGTGFAAEQTAKLNQLATEIAKLQAEIDQRRKVAPIKQKTERESAMGDVASARQAAAEKREAELLKEQQEREKMREQGFVLPPTPIPSQAKPVKKPQVNPRAWRSHPGEAAREDVGKEADFRTRNTPNSEGVDYDPVKEAVDALVAALKQNGKTTALALNTATGVTEDQTAELGNILQRLSIVETRMANLRTA